MEEQCFGSPCCLDVESEFLGGYGDQVSLEALGRRILSSLVGESL
jgi:hypothetical protein